MQNFWILAEMPPAGTSAAPAPSAPAAETPAASAPTAPVKEVPPQPLNETGTTTTSTQAPGSQAPVPGQEKTAPAGGTSAQIMQLIFIIVIFAVMYFMFIRGPKKQQQQQQEMIRSLQKNDRVRTVGGIIGTVVDVKDEYITLKVDETNNTKIRIVPGAISKNLAPETKD